MRGKKNYLEVDAGPLHLRGIRLALNAAYRISPRLAGKWCYRVLAKPPRTVPSATEKALLATARRDVLPVDIMRIRTYHWPGSGPCVLLAHGWNSYSGRWVPLVTELLAAGYDVFALDAPAHGESRGGSFAVIYYGEVMAAAVDALRPHAIIGHSAGGMAALYYLHHHPALHRPDRLALLAVPAELPEFIASFQRVIGMRAEVITAMEKEFLRRFNKSFAYFSNTQYVRQLSMPGLIVHDRTDEIAPVSGADQLANNWSTSELLLTDGLGHSVLSEDVDARILGWLGE